MILILSHYLPLSQNPCILYTNVNLHWSRCCSRKHIHAPIGFLNKHRAPFFFHIEVFDRQLYFLYLNTKKSAVLIWSDQTPWPRAGWATFNRIQHNCTILWISIVSWVAHTPQNAYSSTSPQAWCLSKTQHSNPDLAPLVTGSWFTSPSILHSDYLMICHSSKLCWTLTKRYLCWWMCQLALTYLCIKK